MEQPEIRDTDPGRDRGRGLRSGLLAAGAAFGMTLAGLGIASAQTDGTTTVPDAPAATEEARPHHGPGHARGASLSVAAEALGMTHDELHTALASGQSIAQVAESKGVALQKVVDALVADARAKLAEAVTAGRLPQAQADEKGAALTERITAMVNRTGLRGPGGHGGHHHGPGGPGPDATPGGTTS